MVIFIEGLVAGIGRIILPNLLKNISRETGIPRTRIHIYDRLCNTEGATAYRVRGSIVLSEGEHDAQKKLDGTLSRFSLEVRRSFAYVQKVINPSIPTEGTCSVRIYTQPTGEPKGNRWLVDHSVTDEWYI